MKSIHVLFISLFLCAITVNGQSTQEDPMSSNSVIGYLKIDDISGESKASQYEGQIEVYGLSSTIEQGSAAQVGRGRSRARAKVFPFSMVKRMDSSTAYLMLAGMQGKSFPDMTLTLVKNQKVYAIYRFENVTISKSQLDASSDRQEILSIVFENIDFTYIAPDGKKHQILFDIAAGA